MQLTIGRPLGAPLRSVLLGALVIPVILASQAATPAYATNPPDTLIDSGPPALTTATGGTFFFRGVDDVTAQQNLLFECALDANAFGPCSSPFTFPSGTFSDGSHTLRVRAKDTEVPPLTDLSPASYSWVVDTTGPTLTLPGSPVITPASTTSGTTVSYSATAFDPHPAVSVSCNPASGTFFPLGDTTVSCRATDVLGNFTDDSFVVRVVFSTTPSGSLNATQRGGSGSPVGTFKKTLGSIRISFALTGPSSAVTTLAAKAQVIGPSFLTGNFTFDSFSKQYVYLLNPRSLSNGTYTVQADLGDGFPLTTTITIKN